MITTTATTTTEVSGSGNIHWKSFLSPCVCVCMTAYRMSCFDGWLAGGSMPSSSLSVEMMPKTVNVSKNVCRQSVVKCVSTKVLAALRIRAFRYSQILKSLNESSNWHKTLAIQLYVLSKCTSDM